ncbi:DUF3592 domain-containing protein [Tractidigestivibacter sp.]|uniref:DUF3592 domain-containing protein n=2 Tax=Tractidigestivibacter sp. TaxID=2847320 RepID=UPI002A91A758|nr:DUF3592 domain-containing protein [Tractidigestivibacter sp.]MDY5271307.1 DUF3592 domain-containing protein [Tractidigestivibacter sp.]
MDTWKIAYPADRDPMVVLVVGIAMVAVGVAFLAVAARIRSRWGARDPRTARVTGTVVGGGHVSYGNNHVPRCAYEVGGRRYEVDGPLFESGTNLPGMRCNCTSRESLPSKFRGPSIAEPLLDVADADSWYRRSALYPLYPVGSEVDVYYDPADPSDAYVQRPVRRGVVANTMLMGWGVGLIGLGAFYIFVLTQMS